MEAQEVRGFERIWQKEDSQGQILAFSLRPMSLQLFKLFSLRSEAEGLVWQRPGSPGCHEESEARMVKLNLLTLSALPRRLK